VDSSILPESLTDEACRLGGLFLDSIAAISNGDPEDPSTFFASGSSEEFANICFAAGTPVLMADGTSKPIEQVQAGDQVLASPHDDPKAAPTSCAVVETYHNEPRATIDLVFETGAGEQLTLSATPSHRFYVSEADWMIASEIEPGSKCLARDGSILTLIKRSEPSDPQPVYNLHVSRAHTYFVGESDALSALVHNTCEDPSPLASSLLQSQDSTPFAWTSPFDFQPPSTWTASDIEYATVPAPVTITYTDANAGETVCVYDPWGNLISLTDPLDNETTWTYDGYGRALSETNVLGFTRYYEYDSKGNLTKHTDRRGVEITYTLDVFGNVITETWPDRVIEFEYNRYGELQSVDDATTDYLYTYDDYGRLLREAVVTDSNTTEFIYTYNRYGKVSTVTAFIDGVEDFTNAYEYDFRGRIIDLEQTGPNVIPKQVTFDYASDSLTIQRYEDGNLVVESTTEFSSLAGGLARRSDPLINVADIKGISHVDAQGNVLASHGYTHDETGLVDTYENEDGLVDYDYDPEGQIVSADYDYQTDETFTYDANGNRLAYTVGPNNQVLCDGLYFYAYDASGNRTAKYQWTDSNADGLVDASERSDLTEYSWDARGRLSNITTKPDGSTTSKDVAYSYDYLNRRTEKEITTTDASGSTTNTESYSYLGHDIVLQQNDGELSHRYLHGDLIDHCLADEQLFEENGTETSNVLLPLFDNLGSVRDLVDYDDALAISSVVNHLAYNSFGSIVLETGPMYTCIYGFTGRETDRESGLNFFRRRYYDPQLTVFVSPDPISFNADDTNLYRYVGNHPTSATDPTGKIAGGCSDCGASWYRIDHYLFGCEKADERNSEILDERTSILMPVDGVIVYPDRDSYETTKEFVGILPGGSLFIDSATLTDPEASTGEKIIAGVGIGLEFLPVDDGLGDSAFDYSRGMPRSRQAASGLGDAAELVDNVTPSPRTRIIALDGATESRIGGRVAIPDSLDNAPIRYLDELPAIRRTGDIYIVGKDGKDICQYDIWEVLSDGRRVTVEAKDGMGLGRNPNVDLLTDTRRFAREQIYDAGLKKARGILYGFGTRVDDGSIAPTIDEIRRSRTIRFEVKADSDLLRRECLYAIEKLNSIEGSTGIIFEIVFGVK
jgi:RHS repeat-associated protein